MRIASSLLSLTVAACGVAHSEPKSTQSIQPYLATAIGRLDSADEARHLVAAADGVISALLVERGERVRKGQSLLKVDCAQRLASADASHATAQAMQSAAGTLTAGARPEEVAFAQAQLQAAKAMARNQQQRLTQAEQLIEKGFVSKRDLEARMHERDAALAAVDAESAKLSLLQNGARTSELAERNASARAAGGEARAAASLARQCTLKSPIDGEVLQILRREGEFSGSSQGQPLLVVGNMSKLTVRAEIGEQDAALIVPGQAVEIWVEGQPKKWSGAVTQMAGIMGRRSARSLDPTDRFDRDTREIFIQFSGQTPPPLVGLRLMVGIKR